MAAKGKPVLAVSRRGRNPRKPHSSETPTSAASGMDTAVTFVTCGVAVVAIFSITIFHVDRPAWIIPSQRGTVSDFQHGQIVLNASAVQYSPDVVRISMVFGRPSTFLFVVLVRFSPPFTNISPLLITLKTGRKSGSHAQSQAYLSPAAEELADNPLRLCLRRSHPSPVSPRLERKPVGEQRQRPEHPETRARESYPK